MALTEETIVDKIEIVQAADSENIQVREATIIKRDGEEITRSYHRKVLTKGDDILGESAKVQGIANLIWKD